MNDQNSNQCSDKGKFVLAAGKVGPILAFVAIALIWGTSFYATKVALADLSPIEVLSVRWLIAFVIFLVLSIFKVIKIDFKGKPTKLLILTVLFQPCTYAIFETWGVKLTTTLESAIFIASVPLAVVILGRFITKEKLNRKTIIAVIVGFSGVTLSMLFSPAFSIGGKATGYLALIGAIIVGAMYSLMTSKISKFYSTMEITFAMTAGGGLLFTTICLLEGKGFNGFSVLMNGGSTCWALIYMGVCCSFLAYNLCNYSLSKMPAAVVSSVNTSAINLVAVASGILLSGDPWGWYTIVGVITIIISIIIISGAGSKDHKEGGEGKAEEGKPQDDGQEGHSEIKIS